MTNQHEDEYRDYNFRFQLCQRGIEHYASDPLRRKPYDDGLDALLDEGKKYPQHFWKPVLQYRQHHPRP